MTNSSSFTGGYADVNGLRMYYEIHGQGRPLVLIHGGGSTIETTFGRILPPLAQHRQVIAVELQAHGRTSDRDADLSFTQDADDVATLLKQLNILKADFLGFSNGGQTGIELALRHPELVDRLIIASAFSKRSAAPPQFWEGFDHATPDRMPQVLKDGFLRVNNDPDAFLNMFRRDVQRMKTFQGWTDDQVRSIQAPTLLINGNHDVGSPEHIVELSRLLPNCELAIFPGGHGAYLGAIEALENGQWPAFNATALIEAFLDQR